MHRGSSAGQPTTRHRARVSSRPTSGGTTSHTTNVSSATAGTRRTIRNRSTVRAGAGKTRTITYRGQATTLSGKGVTSGAPAAASRIKTHVDKALARVNAAYAAPRSKAKYGKTFSADDAATLQKSVGASDREARDLSTVVQSESGGDPKAVGDDAAAGYGNTFGLGLWQLTTGVGNDDLINRHGGKEAMLKPRPNAEAALELYRSGGMGNWYGAQGPEGTPGKVPKSGPKPRKKDLETLRRAGVRPTRPGEAGQSASAKDGQLERKTPYSKAVRKAGAVKHPERIINPKWDPDSDAHSETFLAKGISPVVKKWSKKYGVTIGEAKAESGHVSPGHLQTGTATDVYPSSNTEAGWDRLEKGLAVLAASGFEVGYDASRVPGTQSWSNHGRNNHAHIEWSGQGSASDAMATLGGLTNARADKLAQKSGYGSVGGTSSAAAVSAYSQATGVSKSTAQAVRRADPKKFKEVVQKALARVRAAYQEGMGGGGDTKLTRSSRARGAPTV